MYSRELSELLATSHTSLALGGVLNKCRLLSCDGKLLVLPVKMQERLPNPVEMARSFILQKEDFSYYFKCKNYYA